MTSHALRAADAIQLAAAIIAAGFQPSALEFVTLDRNQAAAADKEGFRVIGELGLRAAQGFFGLERRGLPLLSAVATQARSSLAIIDHEELSPQHHPPMLDCIVSGASFGDANQQLRAL